MSERIIIAGPTGGAPNRLEINDFVKNDKFFSLYVQALQHMYDADQDEDELSFFRIAGIHGMPYETWNGAGEKPQAPNRARWGGYCTHSSTLFPTWHRPYVALFEQTLQQQAKKVAETYQVDKEQWVKAAEDIRQPYWDFAQYAVPPEEVLTLTSVTITAPDGTKKSVPNPLHHYTFHPTPDYFREGINRMARTFRRPQGTIQNLSDNVEELTELLLQQFKTRKRNVYNMLTIIDNWPGFSNRTVESGKTVANSLEAIHDNIHGTIGGFMGHMGDTAIAAFDPIFWLHHTNVDRLLSLWSALHPTVWVSPGGAFGGSLTLDVAEPVDENTSLTPFWNSETGFWVSAGLKDTSRQGYSYPEFNGLDLGNAEAVQGAIATIVNSLYDPRSGSIFAMATRTAPAAASEAVKNPLASLQDKKTTMTREVVIDNQKVQVPMSAPSDTVPNPSVSAAAVMAHTQSAVPSKEVPGTVMADQGVDNGFWDWTANVKFKHSELGGSFFVIFFLGPVPEDHTTWETGPNTIGVKFAFVNSSAVHCANCVATSEVLEEGCVPLEDGIIKHSGLTHLTPESVVPYLAENLNWRVIMISTETHETTEVQLPSLEVTVRAYPLTFPEGAYFPIAGETVSYPDITKAKVGGSRE